MKRKRRKIITLFVVLTLLLTVLPPIQTAIAAEPTAVDGRILTAAQTGDSVNWVEVARYGNYSLIVRSSYLNWYPQPGYYNNPKWQYFPWSGDMTSSWANSNVRTFTNRWFNGTNNSTGDNLSSSARLRRFTMQNNALTMPGTAGTQAGLSNGFSTPTAVQSGTGNDIAFALSYSEAVRFISSHNYVRGRNPATQVSNNIADANWSKINVPYPDFSTGVLANGAWLRSPGDIEGTIGAISFEVVSTTGAILYRGRAWQMYQNWTNREHGYLYPALWVDQAIFEPDTLPQITITYHANGGIGAPPPQTVPPGNVTLSDTRPTYGSILFQGWSTNQFATVPQYFAGQTINVSSDMDLYAVWNKAEIIVVHMDKEIDRSMREDKYVIPAGSYGPYAPDTFPGYGPGRHVPSSALPSGTITAFTTRTIIFEYDRTRTVTGLVWPMVVDDLGIGPSFLRRHDIVVELRPSFNRPAAPGLSTTAVVLPTSAVDGIGRFTLTDVPYGDYVLTIKRPGYLIRCMEVRITASSPLVVNLAPPPTDPTDGGVFRLWWGDCNNDFRIDGLDVSMMAALINLNATHPNYSPSCDLNADGQINGLDITMITGNWNKNARQYAGAELINFDI